MVSVDANRIASTACHAAAAAAGDGTGNGVHVAVHVMAQQPSHFAFPSVMVDAPPPTWRDVMEHAGKKLRAIDERYNLSVALVGYEGEEGKGDADVGQGAEVVVCIGGTRKKQEYIADKAMMLATPSAGAASQRSSSSTRRATKVFLALDADDAGVTSSSQCVLRVRRGGGGGLGLAGAIDAIRNRVVPSSLPRGQAKLRDHVIDLWRRQNAEDLIYMLLVLIDFGVEKVPRVSPESKRSGLSTLWCMLKNCRKDVFACLLDPKCREALSCLGQCGLNDQVCSYRCIASYESERFAKFSLCVLQKKNCLGNTATIPSGRPSVQPMTTFRGQRLTHELAESILIGHRIGDGGEVDAVTEKGGSFNDLGWSWKVVCGQNAAYDFFPNQYQVFYRTQSRGRGSMWYDPVFLVRTLDGGLQWRKRHYRVKRASAPGTFFFSALDNGVTSNEFWRIVDAADDMSWALFYYAGAAPAAGLEYTGAVLATPDGHWPTGGSCDNGTFDEQIIKRIQEAHRRCGIEMWELCEVGEVPHPDPPPLTSPRM